MSNCQEPLSIKNDLQLKEQQQPWEAENLRQWCAETWPEVYRYSYSRVRNQEEAEDITQETYTRVLANCCLGEQQSSALSLNWEFPSLNYLKTTALNLIRDRWRRRKTRGIQVQLEEALLVEDRELINLFDNTLVEDTLQKLTEEQQTVLRLRIIEGYSRAETARKMAKSEAAVRGLQYRAIQNLRILLRENFKEVNKR